MDRAEQFDYLMEVIDRWTREKAEKDAGPLRYLEEGSWVREVCVTPGCSISVSQLKTYLSTAVLEIYPWNTGSKVSYRDIRKFLAQDPTAKKYAFYFQTLDKCFSVRENYLAAKRSMLIRGYTQTDGTVGEFPLALLEHIQALVRRKLGEYWEICSPDFGVSFPERVKWKQRASREPQEDEPQADRQNKYMECIMAIALHEIWLRECGRMLGIAYESVSAWRDSIHQAGDEISLFAERLSRADQEQAWEWMRQMEDSVRKVGEYAEQLTRYAFFLAAYTEYSMGLMAELLLVMVMETKNLDVMKPWTGRRQIEWLLKCMDGRDLESFTRYNKNRGKYYKQLQKEVETILYGFMENIGHIGRQSYSEAMRTYLAIVAQGGLDEEKLAQLWEAQMVLALPLWIRE